MCPDAGELFQLFFKHNVKHDINFTLREFEVPRSYSSVTTCAPLYASLITRGADATAQKKRGTLPQKTVENAFEVLQLAHKSYANSQQLFDQYGDTAATISTDCCQLIKTQLSKHTSYQVLLAWLLLASRGVVRSELTLARVWLVHCRKTAYKQRQ